MFVVHMLPAAQGDCVWVEYGPEARPYRLLIDSGTPKTYQALGARIEALPPDQRRFELFIVSHIDTDHIGAATRFLEERPAGVEFGDVWFNGYQHLLPADPPGDQLGVKEGEELTDALRTHRVPWNLAFDGGPVMVPDDGALPVRELPGEMTLTVLSPYREHLAALRLVWQQALEDLHNEQGDVEEDVPDDHLGGPLDIASLAETPFKADPSAPNGSSIAVLAEHAGIRVVFTADAFPAAIERSVVRLLDGTGEPQLRVEAFKVCHHGSRYNTSPSLAAKLVAPRYLISTNGTQTRHPSQEAIARLLHFGEPSATLVFNYRSKFNAPWEAAQSEYAYTTDYPSSPTGGIAIRLQ